MKGTNPFTDELLKRLRAAARDLAHDPHTAESWRAAYENMASACEGLMHRFERSTMRGANDAE